MYSEKYSTANEIKGVLTRISSSNGGGPVLWVDPDTKDVYVLSTESNLIYLGVSGAGKTRRGVISMIMSWINANESFIVVDPKGDLREATSCFAEEAGYDIKTFNFRCIEQSLGFNMLWLPYELYKSGNPSKQQLATEMIDSLAEAIFQHTGENDPYWIESARSLFTGAIYILFEHGTEEQINIPNVYKVIAEGQEKIADRNYLTKLCDLCPDKLYALLLKHVCSAPRETLGSIYSVTYQGMSLFIKNKGITALASSNEFKISSLDGEKPVAIYIITPDENGVYSSISGIIINQLTTYLIKLAHEKFNGKLPRRFNLCIEELGNIGKAIPNLDHIFSAGRSRNLRTAIVLQSLSQLDDLYGQSKATTIISNADTLIAYRTNNWQTLEELSKKCGEREINYGTKTSMEPLITPTQLGAMETGQALCLISGRYKFISWLPDYTEIFDLSKWTPPKTEIHERSDISNMFSICVTVKTIQAKRLEEILREEEEKNRSKDDDSAEPGEEELFVRRYSQLLDNKKYYVVSVTGYASLENRGKIVFMANKFRNKSLPFGHRKPFEVFFPAKDQANAFVTFIKNGGGKAKLDERVIPEAE